jgi:hypothetical protein
MDNKLMIDLLVALTAVGGFALSLMNWAKARNADQVHLVVKPLSIHFMEDDKSIGSSENRIEPNKKFITLGVRIINLSKFDIKIIETGFQMQEAEVRFFADKVNIIPDGQLPYKLPSRESVVIHFVPHMLPPHNIRASIDSIYVHTDCDLEFLGRGQVIEDCSKTNDPR